MSTVEDGVRTGNGRKTQIRNESIIRYSSPCFVVNLEDKPFNGVRYIMLT